MIQHTVAFSLVHAPDSDAEADFLDTAARELVSIPGVADFTIARQISPKSPLRFQFSMVFADQAAHDAYNVHPTHVAFVEGRWVPEVSDFQELDFVAR